MLAVARRGEPVARTGLADALQVTPQAISKILTRLIEGSGLVEALRASRDPQDEARAENIDELVAVTKEFQRNNPDGTLLADWLRRHDVTHVDVCGIATDYCVRATTLDALQEGFEVRVLTGLCAGVAPETSQSATAEMREAGAALV